MLAGLPISPKIGADADDCAGEQHHHRRTHFIGRLVKTTGQDLRECGIGQKDARRGKGEDLLDHDRVRMMARALELRFLPMRKNVNFSGDKLIVRAKVSVGARSNALQSNRLIFKLTISTTTVRNKLINCDLGTAVIGEPSASF